MQNRVFAHRIGADLQRAGQVYLTCGDTAPFGDRNRVRLTCQQGAVEFRCAFQHSSVHGDICASAHQKRVAHGNLANGHAGVSVSVKAQRVRHFHGGQLSRG